MKSRIIIAIALLATTASAEVIHRGKVVQTTADRIIRAERMPCSYGPWHFQALPGGATALVRAKRCEKASR